MKEMMRLGYADTGRKMKVKLVGGASMLDDENLFQIGERNICAIRQALSAYRLSVTAQDLGGKISRNVTVEADTGVVIIASRGVGTWKI
jgi:chemotaxis protein CheD